MDLQLEEGEWPLVTVRWEGAIADARLNAFLARMDAWLERGERFGLLIDSRGAAGMSPEQRSRVIGHMKQRAGQTSKLLVQAIVLDSLLQRTLFYGVNLIFPNPFPSRVFAEPAPARAWLLQTLAAG